MGDGRCEYVWDERDGREKSGQGSIWHSQVLVLPLRQHHPAWPSPPVVSIPVWIRLESVGVDVLTAGQQPTMQKMASAIEAFSGDATLAGLGPRAFGGRNMD